MNEDVLTLASRWKRLGGIIVDVLIVVGIHTLILLATNMLKQAYSDQSTIQEQALYVVLGWAVFLTLNGYLLYTRGQTIGKVVVKTKIVDMGGKIPSFARLVLLRYLTPMLVGAIPIIGGIFGILNPLFIFGKERRCVHDYMAGTRVVNTS